MYGVKGPPSFSIVYLIILKSTIVLALLDGLNACWKLSNHKGKGLFLTLFYLVGMSLY